MSAMVLNEESGLPGCAKMNRAELCQWTAPSHRGLYGTNTLPVQLCLSGRMWKVRGQSGRKT